jgi:hypothetical protein
MSSIKNRFTNILSKSLIAVGAIVILLNGYTIFRHLSGDLIVHEMTVSELMSSDLPEYTDVRIRNGNLDLDHALTHGLKSEDMTLEFGRYIPLRPAGQDASVAAGEKKSIVVRFGPSSSDESLPRDADGNLRTGQMPFEVYGYIISQPWNEDLANGFRRHLGVDPEDVIGIEPFASERSSIFVVIIWLLIGGGLMASGVIMLRQRKATN